MSVWSDNAAAFATRPEHAIAAIRNEAVRRSNHFRLLGQSELAHAVMLAAIERQARLSGIRDVHLSGRSS